MVSTVRSRPNHYETLGLTPAASEADIARAFARKMSLAGAQPVGAAAKVCVAYETLRNSEKRREHDRSLGLAAQPQPRQWTYAAAQPRWAPIASPAPSAQRVEKRAETPAPQPKREEPRVASFIADSLREIAKPPPFVVAPVATESRIVEEWPVVEPQAQPFASVHPPIDLIFDDHHDERGFDWKRPALAVGGLIVAAGVIGALAGMSVQGDEATPRPTAEAGVTVSLPAAKPVADIAAATPAPQAPVQHPVALHKVAQPQPAALVATLDEPVAAETPPVDTSAETPAQPEAAQTVPASMPLPNAIVARTIEKIGYSCGEVASVAAGSSAGVFKVTCSSGATYQATPVHGRYHFRKSGR